MYVYNNKYIYIYAERILRRNNMDTLSEKCHIKCPCFYFHIYTYNYYDYYYYYYNHFYYSYIDRYKDRYKD